ncbi:MAG TPA: deoxyribose-phosphate aldolase [Candidatus Angelobacter sp.]
MSQAISDIQTHVRTWQQVASAIDHTLFKPDADHHQIAKLAEDAVSFGFAAVCVNPCWIALVASILRGTPVKVATTIAFPLGANQANVKRFEAIEAIRTGAQELDMVMNIGALKSGNRILVQNELDTLAEVAHDAGAILKVILETSLLSLEEKILGCQLSLAAKADFVKTGTGFAGSATVEDVALLRGVVGDQAGVKASGGIRTALTANAMLDAGADRIGASTSLAIMRDLGAPERSI